jgi:hypothetical protein
LHFSDDLLNLHAPCGTLVANLAPIHKGDRRLMTSASSSSSPFSNPASNDYTASEGTQQSMMGDLMRQKWLFIGLGGVIGLIWLMSRRSAPEEKAARRLVRDLRHVDDADDVRELLGGNVPVILRPVLLSALSEIETYVHQWFRRVERDIERL